MADELPPPSFAHVKRLEGLASSMKQARDRKRRGLTLHADELPALIEAVELMAKHADVMRLQRMGKL